VKIVLDTNVLVSALLTRGGPCATILDMVLAGALTLCMDERIFAEYERVCKAPRLQLDPASVHTVLGFLREMAERVTPALLGSSLPDPDDRPFLETARTAKAILITGNLKHFPVKLCHPTRVIAPSGFLALLRMQR